MSLFDLNKHINQQPEEDANIQLNSFAVDNKNNNYINAAFDYLSKFRNKIDFDKTNHIVSNGRYSIYDLTGWIAKTIGGEADIIRLTYAISPDAARLYYRLLERNIFRNFTLIIDKTAKKRNALALSILKNSKIHFTENHTKITLISTSKKFITIKGSGNDTQGNRKEDFTLFTDKETYDFYKQLSEQFIEGTA